MAGYTKLFNSILASTIWREDDKTRIVWITLLAMADKYGVAEGSVPGLADFARVSLQDCENALERLQSPDKHSRTKEHDGRRIEVVAAGWRIINHAKYRAKMGADERREYLKLKQREYRAASKHGVDKDGDKSTVSTHTEAEAYSKAEPIQRTSRVVTAPPIPVDADVVGDRAAALLERFPVLFMKHRKGARTTIKPALDFQRACDVCRTWTDDARLDKLIDIFLTTDEPWISETGRGFGVFASKASWCDDRLKQWELANGVTE